MKRRSKMLIQIGVAFVIVFSVSTVLLGMLVAVGATRLFLGSKEDMVEQDLIKLYNSFEGLPYHNWAMKYWEQHAEEITEKRTDLNYDPESNETVSKALTFPYSYTDEQLDSLSEEDQLALGTHLYNMTYSMFMHTSFNYQYESAYVIDISEENRGFVFLITDVSKIDNSLGSYMDYDKNEHPAVSAFMSGDYEPFEFEISNVDLLSGQRSYIGYVPLKSDGEVKYAICISYNWTSFSNILISSLATMLLIGLIIGLLTANLLMIFVYNIAIKPLKRASDTVNEYSVNKDSVLLANKLRAIKSKNEVEVLTDEIAKMVEEIDNYNKEITTLATEKERVKAELEFAAKIQSSMLSKNFPVSPVYELSALMDPAKEVGGDFYDFFMIDYNHLGLVIADVSGKGVPASLFMAMSKMNIRNFAGPGITPAETLKAANDAIVADNENKMFVTVWFGIVELSSGHVCAANAGHEYPVIRRADGEFEVFKDKHSLVLGAINALKTHDYEFDLGQGDILFVYTDGAPEANDKDNNMFGMDRLVESLNKCKDESPSDIISSVHSSIDEFVGAADQFDDLTMMCFKYKGRKKK